MNKVPLGVAILGFLALLQGVVAAFFGIVFLGVVAFGPAVVGDGIVLAGAMSLVIGILYIAVAGAAWTLQPWAWLFGELMAIIGLVQAIFFMLASSSLTWGLASVLFPVLILWYLNRADIKAAFGVEGA